MADAILHRTKKTPEEVKLARRESSKKHYHANKEKINARHADWLAANKDKTKASHKKWLADNSEKVKAYVKDRYQKEPEKFKAVTKKWFTENKKRAHEKTRDWQIANPEKVKSIMREWRIANPEKCRIYDANRRARKLEGGGNLSSDIADRLFKLQRGKCACCGSKLDGGFHLDHIIPLRLGGLNIDSNIQLLTKLCNQQKHAKDPIDFMQSRGFLL